jgi:hypothetical protein
MLRLIAILVGSISPLVGVFFGYRWSKRTQEKMLKVQEIRNELEKAYGPLYSIVSRPEEMVKIEDRDDRHERRVVISEEEKRELDRILICYPHMFPYEIVVLWRTQIKNLESFRTSTEIELGSHSFLSHPIDSARTAYVNWFGIPLEFKDKITEEYERRREEYYKTTGRWKDIKDLPKWARA